MKTEQQKTEVIIEFIKWVEKNVSTNHLGYRDIQWPDTFSDGEIHMDCWPELVEKFLRNEEVF